jgi:hypothetical protein
MERIDEIKDCFFAKINKIDKALFDKKEGKETN